MREDSRTRLILEAAKEILSLRYEIEHIDINKLAFAPLNPETLRERNSGIIPEKALALAQRIASADRLVVAAPFWDMSFPAVLKAFFENMSLYNVTFSDNGSTCTGLCSCKKLLYITTRGMDIPDEDPRNQGSTYLKALSSLWGLGEVITLSAWNLDYLSEALVKERIERTIEKARQIAKDF